MNREKNRLLALFGSSMRSALRLWFRLLQIMVPISIIVRICSALGAVEFLGEQLEPIMILVGLPGLTGIVWAATLITNLWAGALLFAALQDHMTLTVGQVSILGIMMLISHGLPLELRMVQKCGVSALWSFVIRFSSSILVAYVYSVVFDTYGLLQAEAAVVLSGPAGSDSLLQWAVNEAKSYIFVLGTISALVLLLDMLKEFSLLDALARWLSPFLAVIGVTAAAAPITFVGMTLGLVYGGGLLLNELEKNNLSQSDVHLSITSMNLTHSLIEDTIIILLMGGSFFWVFVVRILYTAVFMSIYSNCYRRIARAHRLQSIAVETRRLQQ